MSLAISVVIAVFVEMLHLPARWTFWDIFWTKHVCNFALPYHCDKPGLLGSRCPTRVLDLSIVPWSRRWGCHGFFLGQSFRKLENSCDFDQWCFFVTVSTQTRCRFCRCSAALGKASVQDVGMRVSQEGISYWDSQGTGNGINLEMDWVSFPQRVYFSGSYAMNHVHMSSQSPGLAFRKNWKIWLSSIRLSPPLHTCLLQACCLSLPYLVCSTSSYLYQAP